MCEQRSMPAPWGTMAAFLPWHEREGPSVTNYVEMEASLFPN